MKDLELTPRLRLLADWVPPGAKLADVGTDHAYLPVWLLLHGRVRCAIAGDLRPGPLERARQTGARYGAELIDFRLCDGLSAIAPEEADTIVIAGMGGETIAAILAAAPWTRSGRHTLLLQPMTKAEELRRFLAENGYSITREALVRDRGTLYPVLEATAGEMTLTTGQLYGGAALLNDPLGDRYLIEKIIRLQGAVAGLNHSGDAADRARSDALRDILTALLEMREEWRHAHCR
ncbi:class I SAM-dependent methyltransferase [Oscillibacter sp.]|uniref:tRNA (adenine(22)-N(1))-methyltransferase n=1 Tax=Oscillibacter sp. TaxID=1945593 RepID=UPI002615ED2F|nr:class I SAM-dependent methyltransferase [Oscillibacter sp.]MDD3346441.1 class I SAM-dependent methyltransferase [Oscillibacter sp.]